MNKIDPDNRWPIYVVALIIGIFIGTWPGGVIGESIGTDNGQKIERKKAIEAGVAYYWINAKTGEKRFIYGIPKDDKGEVK